MQDRCGYFERDSLGLLGLVLLDLALNLVLIFERGALGCPARHGYLIGASTCQRSQLQPRPSARREPREEAVIAPWVADYRQNSDELS
eukprot:COSAG06_NODE_595_length_13930_cov_54.274962_11_plen_88_part_00